ncbi:unnamed protein product [Chrysoparadoxa australica]
MVAQGRRGHMRTLLVGLAGIVAPALSQFVGPDVTVDAGRDVTAAFAGELNGDFAIEVVANPGGKSVKWYSYVPPAAGEELGQWAPHDLVERPGAVTEDMEELVDINMDGYDDVVLLSDSAVLSWYENVNKGEEWTQHVVKTKDFYSIHPWSYIFSGDMDDDGDYDLVDISQDPIVWYENRVREVGAEEEWLEHPIPVTSAVGQAWIADLNGDGYDDILVSEDENKYAWYENPGPVLARGDGRWAVHTLWEPPADAEYNVAGFGAITTGDIDKDGDMDVVIGVRFGFFKPTDASKDVNVVWLENDGNQMFTQHLIAASEDAHADSGLILADMDGDGYVDIVASSSQQDVTWFKNAGAVADQGDRFPTAAVRQAPEQGITSLVAADMDADGDLDILTASSINARFRQAGEVAWLVNDGLFPVPWEEVLEPPVAAEDAFIPLPADEGVLPVDPLPVPVNEGPGNMMVESGPAAAPVTPEGGGAIGSGSGSVRGEARSTQTGASSSSSGVSGVTVAALTAVSVAVALAVIGYLAVQRKKGAGKNTEANVRVGPITQLA